MRPIWGWSLSISSRRVGVDHYEPGGLLDGDDLVVGACPSGSSSATAGR